MNWLVEALFRPSNNRYYVGRKGHRVSHIIEIILASLIGAIIGYIAFGVLGMLIGGVMMLFSTIGFDYIIDKIEWQLYKKLGFKEHKSNLSQKELLKQAQNYTDQHKK